MLQRKIYNLFLLLLMVAVATACLKSKRPGIPEPVRRIIDLSGINRTQFLEALVKYENPVDTLKRKALYYLIANMGSHYEISYKLSDSAGNIYNFPLKDYPDYQTLIRHYRLIEAKHGKLFLEHDTIILDIDAVSSRFLTTTVDTAFNDWELPRFSNYYYSFQDFCEYILPYRVANEKPEPFRHFFKKRYQNRLQRILPDDQANLVSLIGNIHRVVSNDIKYDRRFEKYFNYPSINEILKARSGNYRDLAIYEVKVFRSFGIASTMDYTPYFADSAGGYFWPVVKVDSGEFIPVFRSDAPINNYTLPGRIPKVFRREYYDDSTTLFRIKKISEHTPAFIGQFNYKDVTNEYISAVDVQVQLDDTSGYAYLSVFNNGIWHPIHWSLSANKSKITFTKMGTNIVYLPVIMRNNKLKPAGRPFLVHGKNNITYLSGKTTEAKEVSISQTAPGQYLKPHTEYNIFKWSNNHWELEQAYLTNFQGVFKSLLSENSLYLVSKQSYPEFFTDERIFILSGNHLLFY